MFKYLFLLIIALISIDVYCQKTSNAIGRNCGTIEYQNIQIKLHPEYENQRKAAQQNALSIANNSKIKSNTVIVIPVVVHVVYNNSAENISDAQIQSQIDILNQDFRNNNTDNIPTAVQSAFGSLRSDAQIEFCLAQRDPNNQATNGITRTQTTHGSFYLENDVKFNSTGGIDVWDATKYLNLWVCNLSQDLLGYAQFPGDNSSTDGVVIRYNSFGNVGNVAAPYNKGRTATHEIGHWLGLQHIWGNDPNCADDDNVSDTPQQKDQNGGCPSFPQTTQSGGSCSGLAPGSMFMNYMDYTDDACMYMFTNGQKSIMSATLASSRASLKNSNACSAPNHNVGYSCDTLNNLPAVYSQAIYTAGSGTSGYLAGHNSYGDLAKAEKFNNALPNYQVNGCFIKFSRISSNNSNATFNLRVWANNGGLPGAVLASETITYASIITDVSSNATTFISFANPAIVSGSFFVGVEFGYAGVDTLAIYTTTINDIAAGTSNAFEKGNNGTWHNINTAANAGGWGIDLSLFIFPVVCDKFESVTKNYSDTKDEIFIYPNPASNQLFISVSKLKNASINIFTIAGANVLSQKIAIENGTFNLDISNLKQGIYFVEIANSEVKTTKKLLIK